MYITSIVMALFATSALAADVSDVWTDATSFGAMLARGDVIAKRQGYVPQQRTCGSGRTCQEACGPNHVQCPSTDSRTHCHDPTTGTHCCLDGTGNACRAGYYCTTDGLGRTYCCPDGLQNAECAKLYSLTISLMRETSRTALPTPSTGRPFSVTVLSTPTSKIHVTMTASTAHRNATSTYKSAVKSASRNATSSFVLPTGKFNVTTSTTPPLFTGAAGKAAAGGMAILAGAAGLLF